MKIGFIGAGNMGGAIARGIVKSGVVAPEDVFLYDVNPAAAQALAGDTGARAVDSALDLTANAQLLVLAVKPVYVRDALAACYAGLAGKAIVSIVAGLSGETLARLIPQSARCIQTMPNTPAMVSAGVTALCAENTLNAQEREFVRAMFAAVGSVVTLPGRLIEAESAVAGSGPAFAAMLVEALADGGVLLGLPRAQAMEMAAQMMLGTAKMLLEGGKHPAQVKDMVCSPGGTTIEGVRALEAGGFRAAVINAVVETGAKALAIKREAEKG